jgi:hypothetical protein
MLAARLLSVGAFVFLAPGLACVARMPDAFEWPEHLVYGFAISYVWAFAMSVVLPLLGWTVDYAGVLTAAFVALVTPWRRLPILIANGVRAFRPSTVGVVLSAIVVAYAIGAWWIEPVMHGDASVDLLSVSRFADGGPIHLDNTSIVTASRAAYIFQPYQMMLGLAARWSGAETIVAFEKIRPLLVFLSLASVFVLIGELTVTRVHALWAFTVVLVFIGFDMATWQDKSLYPVVHRGGIAAGICVPVLMTLILSAARVRAERDGETRQRLSMWLAPVFLVAFLCTHALEVYSTLFFAAAAGIAVFIGADRSRDRRRILQLGAWCVLALALYLPIRSRLLPDFTAFEDGLKSSTLAEFEQDHPTLGDKLSGVMSQESEDLLAHRLPMTTAAVLGVPALAGAVLIAPAAATMLSIGIFTLAALFAVPAGFILLALATSADSVQETPPYFALLGLLGVALGIAGIVSTTLDGIARFRARTWRVLWFVAASAVLVVAWRPMAIALTTSALAFVRNNPRVAVGITAGVLILVTTAALLRHGRRPVVGAIPAVGGAVLAALLAYPLAGLGLPNTERVNFVSAVRNSRTIPSVLDGSRYYDLVAQSILPPLPMPPSIVGDLRTILPPRQVLLANPHYSCSITALVDAYCVNPEHIYGQYFLGARRYQLDYVYSIEGSHADWHPFFNDTWPLEARERRFLNDYHVTYLLADPSHLDLISRKLDALHVVAAREYSRDGYVLYRLESAR